ncbi:MAG TPA: isoprenylcysteine carboxylmethyltransferase family protein [Thermoanaerobaculales bacterium]|nr:isoprenylcysteine carboxylmethyltransferase family protein [Thermoanaerobaculales bacterium]HPA80066.1 isoprenylcysteine carboxylmethyltransferase family protein [Thermoanaerobaculales bacterium]HQL29891.1 isoprenylcysteine carboxylmethyltransferase family protein [Thermoanaerobaculales bacterium]HQN95003.1 isoprenylcysteine carboxylmethyltransferase family protein [Thermoanaerobaculales bacterium]HQP42399.1 isoprenylcysteine carboxylmethyltransferase family protein [Thermoanaerobaculales ba
MIDDRVLGLLIFVLLAVLVVVKQVATGRILDRPEGSLLVQLVNVYNLVFLLVVNPLAGVLLLTGRLAAVDPSRVAVREPWLGTTVQIVGLAVYVVGFAVMAWALITLRRGYQLGGLAPRADDHLVTTGPYSLVRHPMYASVLLISFGLACLTQSSIGLGLFGVYLVLIHPLMRIEETRLQNAYGESYSAYRRGTRRLIPFVY